MSRPCVVLLLLLGILGCSAKETSQESSLQTGPFSSEDLSVVSRTLEEVHRIKRQKVPTAPPVLRVIDETILFGPDHENQLNSDLREKSVEVSKELRESLLARNTKSLPIRRLTLSTPKVVVKPLAPLYSDDWNESEIFARISRPGYDAEKRSAIMYCRTGPSAHGESITVILDKIDGEWRVRWSQVVAYF